MKESAALRRTAQVLRERGWCQGEFASEYGECCVIGALRVAFGSLPTQLCMSGEDYYEARSALIAAVVDGEIDCVADWNDTPGRTKDEVISALESTATRLEGEGR